MRNDPDISDKLFEIFQTLICDVYGRKSDRVNLLRHKLYSSRREKLEAKSIPLCFGNLQLHLIFGESVKRQLDTVGS